MNNSEEPQQDLQRTIESLRERLSDLSRAGRRITGDLDLDTVLQETVDVVFFDVPADRLMDTVVSAAGVNRK